jgi:hypothetical protein
MLADSVNIKPTDAIKAERDVPCGRRIQFRGSAGADNIRAAEKVVESFRSVPD